MTHKARKEALDRLENSGVVERVIWPKDADAPTYIYGRISFSDDDDPAGVVSAFLEKHGAIYGIASRSEYRVTTVKTDTKGNRNVWVERLHRGLRVYPSRMAFWLDPSGVLIRIQAKWPALSKSRSSKPKVSAAQAVRSVAKLRSKAKLAGAVREPRLEYHVVSRGERTSVVLGWNFVARFDGDGPGTEGFVVNAMNGKLLRRYSDEDEAGTTTTGIGINNTDETAASPVRTINVDDPGGGADLTLLDTSRTVDIETRDMGGASSLGGAYSLCADDDSDGFFNNITNVPRRDSDRPEVGAHYNTGLMHDYLARSVTVNAISLFGRTGWANSAAQAWISLVHKDTDSISSFFSRSSEVTAHGDGDGTNMTYKSTLDTCAHEWGHAVQYNEIPGGLSTGGFDSTPEENFVVQEATADMFAGAINLEGGWRFSVAFEDDATMAAGTHATTGSRLRGFRDPSAYTQPDHYQANADTLGQGWAGTGSNYTRTGILDKAAYMMAAGGTHPSAASDPATYPPIAVYGMGVRCFENIFYYAITQLTAADDLLADFRQNMIDAAIALYPGSPCKQQTVERAFDAVGIYASGTTPPAIPSGPDPMITPWGSITDVPPYWQTPDIYVKDAADVIVPPLKGQINRLFANVSNIGDVNAIGVEVAFSFKPYGMGTSNNAEKAIGTVLVDIPAGTSLEVEIAWDLTDLLDTNLGLWPLPLGDFDHFCVKVRLTHATDVDTCNNEAQNNFGNVGDADGADGETNFILANVERTPRWIALVPHHRIPDDWEIELDLKRISRGNSDAIRDLVKVERPELPWVGDLQDAILIPMRGGEVRAAQFKWRTKSRKNYDGPVHGCLYGAAKGGRGLTGRLMAHVRHLTLMGRDFRARIVGRVKTRGGNAALRGELRGEVDPRSGKFRGAFQGVVSLKKASARQASFKAEGVMGAAASFSFAVINGGDRQGIDLGARIIGDPEKVCAQLRVRPGRPKKGRKSGRPRKAAGKKAAKRKPAKRKATKRKATKRKATKRKATKRKATKRKPAKRKPAKRKATKRKAVKRATARKTGGRKPTKRKATTRKSPR